MLYTQFPDQLDPAALDIVLAAFKGQIPDKSKAALCALNVSGFALGKVLGQPATMQAGAESLDVDTVFAAAKAACSMGMMSPAGWTLPPGTWALVLSVAIKVLTLLAAA